MKVVLLADSLDSQLWPFTSESKSSQFIKALKDNNGNPESIMQRIWRQLSKVGLTNSALVSSSKAQLDFVNEQLPEARLVIEPDKQNTFAKIAYSCVYLHSALQLPSNEVICVVPSNLLVGDEFFRTLRQLPRILTKSGTDIALIGCKPTYPSPTGDYIIPFLNEGKYEKLVRPVRKFVPKPTIELAEKLILEGGLWNSGVYCFRLGYFISFLKKRGIPTEFFTMIEHYSSMTPITFEDEIMAKTERIVVIRDENFKKQVISWDQLMEELSDTLIGNGSINNDCRNTHVINDLNIPLIVDGLNDAYIVCSSEGILVKSKKNRDDYIKE